MMFLYSVVFAVVLFDTVTGFNPMLTLDNCTRKSVSVTLTGGENDGIIYVHGQGAGCKQTTSSKPSAHTFALNQCNIKWGETFRLVVQRKASYQTGKDKQIPVTCLADLSDIDVTNKIGIAAHDDDAEQTMYIKPSASMRLLKNGRSIGSAPVSLGDVITMELRLHPDYEQDFDISAKTCSASSIPIIIDQCAVDARLFPRFTRVSRGFISSAFGAFRTTNLMGGSVTMTFTCTLEVCLGNCNVSLCENGQGGRGKQRRGLSSLATRQFQGHGFDIPLRDESAVTVTEPTHQHNDTNLPTKRPGSEVKYGNAHKTKTGQRVTHKRHYTDVTTKRDVSQNENNVSINKTRDEDNSTDFGDVKVQGILTIAPDEDLQQVTAEKTELCMNYGISITLIVVFAVAFVGVGVTSWILLRRGVRTGRQLERRLPPYHYCGQEDF